MKTFLKEIQTYIIIGAIALIAVSILLLRIKRTRSAANTNLIEMVPSSASALIRINKPKDMRKYVLSEKNINAAFNTQIPQVFVSLINFIEDNQPCIFSFHPQGVILYAHANSFHRNNIKQNIIHPYFGSFAPQTQKIANTNIKFYVGKNNQYLGYYLKKDILVTSFSRKLLEETLTASSKTINANLAHTINEADQKVPFNLFIHSDLLNLYINLSDSTVWKLNSRWLSADFFMNKRKLCYFGNLPYFKDIDSLYTPLADTLSTRIKAAFPQLNISSETNIEADKMLYSGRFE